MKRVAFPSSLTLHLTEKQRRALQGVAHRLPEQNDEAVVNHVLTQGFGALLSEESQKPADAREKLETFATSALETLERSREGVPTEMTVYIGKDQRKFLAGFMNEWPDLGLQRIMKKVIDLGLTKMQSQSTGLTPDQKQACKDRSEREPVAPGFATGRRRTASQVLGPDDIEHYLGFPVSDYVQERLVRFMGNHPGTDIEHACSMLLEEGLSIAEGYAAEEDGEDERVEREAAASRERVKKADDLLRLAERLYRRSVAASERM